MNVQTYLYFAGDCVDALSLYREVLGMEVEFSMTYADGPAELMPVGWEDKIFHATGRFGETLLNLSDSISKKGEPFAGFSLLAHLDSPEEVRRAFEAFSHDGGIVLPLGPTPWSECYGIVTDRFGVTWKIQA